MKIFATKLLAGGIQLFSLPVEAVEALDWGRSSSEESSSDSE